MVSQAPILFLLACLIVFVGAYLIVRWQYSETLTLLKTRNETLTASVHEKTSKDISPNDDPWLNAVAEHDRLELHTAVYVMECRVRESLTGEDLCVVFDFYVRNGTVYAVSVDPDIKGFISLNNVRLRGEITASSLPHNLQHCWGDRFRIRQELNAKDVAAINELDTASKDQGFYDFGNLHITIKGTSPTIDALPARLQFKRVTRRLINNGFELV